MLYLWVTLKTFHIFTILLTVRNGIQFFFYEPSYFHTDPSSLTSEARRIMNIVVYWSHNQTMLNKLTCHKLKLAVKTPSAISPSLCALSLQAQLPTFSIPSTTTSPSSQLFEIFQAFPLEVLRELINGGQTATGNTLSKSSIAQHLRALSHNQVMHALHHIYRSRHSPTVHPVTQKQRSHGDDTELSLCGT